MTRSEKGAKEGGEGGGGQVGRGRRSDVTLRCCYCFLSAVLVSGDLSHSV